MTVETPQSAAEVDVLYTKINNFSAGTEAQKIILRALSKTSDLVRGSLDEMQILKITNAESWLAEDLAA